MEIEDREVSFRSWKAYALSLRAEVKCLQQFLSTDRIKLGYMAFKREAERQRR